MITKISSSELGGEPAPIGNVSGELNIYDGLSTPTSSDVIILSDEHTAMIEEFARAAAGTYGDQSGVAEPTLVQSELGVPSLVVRVDATIVDGAIKPYEMEDSPSGQGITDRILTAAGGAGIRGVIITHYEDTIGAAPTILVSPMRSHGTDDELIVGSGKYSYNSFDPKSLPSGPVIVKAIPGKPESHEPYLSLQPQAVAPLVTEGDKSYLERLGRLEVVNGETDLLVDDAGELISQVVKARQGSMAQGVTVYLTPTDRSRFTRAGTVTASKLRRNVGDYTELREGALVQPFIPPIQIQNEQGRSNMILRVFVLLGGVSVTRAIGGCYVARQSLVVHGSSDATSGGVLLERDIV